jgi:predicted nuclease of predicted toxin-antitoxin system
VKFIADESVDKHIIDRLRQDGCFVDYVAEMDPGITDQTVFDLANKNQSILLTADKDFGEIVFRQRQISAGIILLRLSGITPTKKALLVSSIINKHFQELTNAFSVITATGIRIRKKNT